MIGTIENAIVARIKGASDAGVLGYKLRTVTSYDDEFDEDIDEVVKSFPAVWAAWAGYGTPRRTGREAWQYAPVFSVICGARSVRNRAAARHGAEIRTGCIVEGIETAGGAVTGLRSEAGEVRAGTVLIAAGAWTGPMLRRLGHSLPQLRVRSTVLRTKPAAELTGLGVWCDDFGFRQGRDGSFTIGAGDWVDHDIEADSLRHFRHFWPAMKNISRKPDLHLGWPFIRDLVSFVDGAGSLRRALHRQRVLDPAPEPKKLKHTLGAFQALFPEFKDARIAKTWAGVIDVTPDEVPVFGEAPGLRGLVIATGFSGHGFGMGPITGKVMAELIAEGRPSLDLNEFRFTRFSEPRTPAASIHSAA